MRTRPVLPLLRRQMRVIGQARIDTALFLPPVTPTPPRRGRKGIHGERLSAEAVAALPITELSLSLYGQDQLLRLRSVVALARFLKGTPVRAVWCQFFDARKQTWTKPPPLLAMETEQTAEAIVRLYARRWGTESLFHNLSAGGVSATSGSSRTPRWNCGCRFAPRPGPWPNC